MSTPVEKLTDAVLALPASDRAQLVDRLVESLDPLDDKELRALWAAEAMRRRDEVRSGVVKTIPAEVAATLVRKALKT